MPATPSAPPVARARGADFSSWQNEAAVVAALAHGLDFGIVKATQGLGYRNPLMTRQVELLTDHNCVVGLYHFLGPDDGARQFDFFEHGARAAAVRLLAADYEASGVTDAIARAFIRRGHERGFRIGLYGSADVARRHLGQDWTWAAWWNLKPPPFRWDVWQFAVGVDGGPDWNLFRGARAEIRRFAAENSR